MLKQKTGSTERNRNAARGRPNHGYWQQEQKFGGLAPYVVFELCHASGADRQTDI